MEKVTVFLRTSLFALPGPDGHLPPGVTVIEGSVLERPAGALRVETSRLLDERGRALGERVVVLDLPWAKIDHVLLRAS